ncbi:MAG: secondary thiamine-phosphate synthase enzyme YjbQ [Ignavibacteria bacterium]|nr:secondary thiamine-phosphate synthase enzyme YjbQ [Ignavibacteria bacterium]
MQRVIKMKTDKHNGLYDISDIVRNFVKESKYSCGLVNVYARGATCAIMIQENWDQSVQNDVISLLKKLIPKGVWQHDLQDNNGDAHLKSGLIGPSQTIPIINGNLGLSTWQSIFFCEFDGPRNNREIVVTIYGE